MAGKESTFTGRTVTVNESQGTVQKNATGGINESENPIQVLESSIQDKQWTEFNSNLKRKRNGKSHQKWSLSNFYSCKWPMTQELGDSPLCGTIIRLLGHL